MRRRGGHIIRGILLAVCLGMVVLWVRSFWVGDLLEHHRRGDRHAHAYDEIHGTCSSRGSIGVGFVRIEHPGVEGFEEKWLFESSGVPGGWPMRFAMLGFGYWDVSFVATAKRGVVHAHGFEVPHLFIAALAGIAPGIWARKRWIENLRERRTARGLCSQCGYDLRGGFDRCPECGSDRQPQLVTE